MYEKKVEAMDRQELLNVYEEMKLMASRDALTGLYNRGETERKITQRLKERKEGEGCAFFMVDLDHFKMVNDRLGHQTGDHVLETAASILSGMFLKSDIVGRLGGDEFVVFLCGEITEKLVREKGKMICDQLQLVLGEHSEIVVTASVGIHLSLERTDWGFEYLYRSADQALYRAKEGGRQSYCLQMSYDEEEKREQKSAEPVKAIRLQGILDYMGSGVALMEIRHPMSFFYVSPAFAAMLGREEKEILKAHPLDFVYPRERRRFETILQEEVMDKGEAVNHVVRMLAKDGSLMWWRVHAARVKYNEDKDMVLATVIDITELKEKESALRYKNSLFLEAMGHNMQRIWEVDIPAGTFRIMGDKTGAGIDSAKLSPFPRSLLESGWIAEESADRFREFAAGILGGRQQGYGNFRVRYSDMDSCRWAAFSYRTVFDGEGRPLRAVGLVELIGNPQKDRAVLLKPEAVPGSLMKGLLLQMEGNLSQDTITFFWMEGRRWELLPSCSWFFQKEKERMASPGLHSLFEEYLFTDRLLRSFREGRRRWLSWEYQRVDDRGEVHWVSFVIWLHQEEGSEDVCMTAWISCRDQKHFRENGMSLVIDRDPRSMLYTHSTARTMAHVLMEGKKNTLCSLVLVEISGITRLYTQEDSHKERKWEEIFDALLLGAGGDCVAGQLGQNRYTLFFPETEGEKEMKDRLEHTMALVKMAARDAAEDHGLRFLFAGAVCRYEEPGEYDIMMKKVQVLCGLWSNATDDRIVFADEEEEGGWDQLLWLKESDHMEVFGEESPRPFSDREKDAAFAAVTGILDSESIREAARCVLQVLGEYYDADRAYILVPMEYGHVLHMPHEWTSGKKSSIQHILSGMRITNFPMIQRCMEEDRSVLFARKRDIPVTGARGGMKEDAWNYAVFPMRNRGGAQGYLCIENAHNPISDPVLPEYLSACLMKERQKYINDLNGGKEGYVAGGMDLPNLGSYVEQIYTYHSQLYRSLGVVCLDVPQLSAISERQGFEYGRRLLLYVIQLLAEIFGRTKLFRTWDAEFVALCPNTTEPVFLGKCSHLRSAISQRYPGKVRIGHTWASSSFRGKDLADEARILMRCDMTEKEGELQGQQPAREERGAAWMRRRAQSFTVHLQPSFRMATRMLLDAELLIRGIGHDGRLLLPWELLGGLKEKGSIRDMDFLVLEKAMYLLDRWKDLGKKAVPVSVHLSGSTLCRPSFEGALLAIQSRYPKADGNLLKIEVSQEDFLAHREKLTSVMERYREMGVGFYLNGVGEAGQDLELLFQAPVQCIKLAPHLVSQMLQREECTDQIKEILELSQKNGLPCTAVGVVSEEQVIALTRLGCGWAQGYYYEKPMPAEAFEKKYCQ